MLEVKLRKWIPASNLGEAQGPRHDNSTADLDGQNMRTERESKEKDTHKLIVEVAERLFRQIGFQKTTVADISRELHMSPANVYRFFAAKSEINEAVCMDLLGKIEAEAEKIAASRSTATQRIRNLIGAVEKTHHKSSQVAWRPASFRWGTLPLRHVHRLHPVQPSAPDRGI